VGLTIRNDETFWDDGTPYDGLVVKNSGQNKVSVWDGLFDDIIENKPLFCVCQNYQYEL